MFCCCTTALSEERSVEADTTDVRSEGANEDDVLVFRLLVVDGSDILLIDPMLVKSDCCWVPPFCKPLSSRFPSSAVLEGMGVTSGEDATIFGELSDFATLFTVFADASESL